jgi:hypothetical protein
VKTAGSDAGHHWIAVQIERARFFSGQHAVAAKRNPWAARISGQALASFRGCFLRTNAFEIGNRRANEVEGSAPTTFLGDSAASTVKHCGDIRSNAEEILRNSDRGNQSTFFFWRSASFRTWPTKSCA